ncbi:UNVERIFIED_CONTAM: F-box/LRR-repeat protein 12 [Sesamum calycinum]|uniref:F-box/LRR-repeat protein 12 n=1 Tax=Sesamum calycinum TaxID=2727403 RepID=A0AAW2SCX7_9LAMI
MMDFIGTANPLTRASRFTQVDEVKAFPYRGDTIVQNLNFFAAIVVFSLVMDMETPPHSVILNHQPCRAQHISRSWLESSNDRESFGLTCHRWLHIQNSSRRSLQFQCSFTQLNPTSLSRPSTTINTFHLYRLLCRFPQLQSLSLSGCIELPDSGLSLLLTYGLKLESLHLDFCYGITDHGFSFIAGGCPLLTIISLYRCNVTDIGLESLSQSCSTLKDVNLSFCSLISDHGIRALSQNSRHLRSVNISYCRNVTGVGFQGCSQTLAYLEADSCKLEPEGILAIVSGGGLEYLNISKLKSCIHGYVLTTIDVGFISKLRVLNFRLWTTIGDDAIAKIAEGCPLLEEWNLDYCFEIRISGWESIGSKCRNLERLHVNRCRNLSDQGLQALRDGCRRLRKLYLGRCRLISSISIEMFKYLRSDVQIMDEAT